MKPQEQFRTQPPPPLPSRAIQIPKAYETTLANGIVVVLVKDTRLPLVSYRLAFRTGDAHDPRELPGLTDLLTGLVTEGTQSLTSRQIADEVGRMGATLSAGATADYSTIAASSLSAFGDNMLELIADVTRNPSFPDNEVELLKQNTKESLKQQRAQPTFLATEMLSRVIFGEHPYSVVAPTLESLEAVTREKIAEFHRSMFLPNNAVLVAAGDIDQDTLLKRIEALFGDWQPGELPKDDFSNPPVRSSRSAYLVDRPGSAQSNIVIANLGITRTSPDYFPMLVMHTVLGANASSRLFMNLREEKGYTYGAYSSLDARRAAGTFRVSAEVRSVVTGDSLKEFFYELDRIREQPVSEQEIADAQSYLTGVFPLRLETQEGLIDQLVQIKMYGLPDNYLETYRERIQAVTGDDIQQVATKYVKPDEAAVVIVGDGREILQQVEPYSKIIELYNTSGKRKEKPSGTSSSDVTSSAIFGRWTLDIQTPFGQNIPATLTVSKEDSTIVGKIESEMGDANIVSVTLDGNSFTAVLSFDMGGQSFEAHVAGEISEDSMEGNITLQDSPPLPFTGSRSAN
ncbi:MAG TPA: pitrilysin family protein [Pyrinomonadaceae bacterium]|nr:pitrilysin family protein [Pyrinomonadaceae bacterium]